MSEKRFRRRAVEYGAPEWAVDSFFNGEFFIKDKSNPTFLKPGILFYLPERKIEIGKDGKAYVITSPIGE